LLRRGVLEQVPGRFNMLAIGETTVVRHYARLTDLAPDLAGAAAALALVALIRWFIEGPAVPSSPIADDDPAI